MAGLSVDNLCILWDRLDFILQSLFTTSSVCKGSKTVSVNELLRRSIFSVLVSTVFLGEIVVSASIFFSLHFMGSCFLKKIIHIIICKP